ncbi:hypothetical protein M501DRAFT_1051776 [Patellaria atrata CBS 101060]|uniref:Rhodopsin domain-containing protein n=1 Tax=Patellaria atrata CBS 101060 TaxID=1346257 RepID=A0A9P4SB92_9PEZI|nr:hypothetical protein M501DRAFT_1051776 [Patellaria atrata CBS 101060]
MDNNLKIESWIWYAVCLCIIVVRLISRILLLGSPKRLQFDDAMMVFALSAFTVLIVTINIIAKTSSNLLPEGEELRLTEQDIKERIYGSKIVVAVEQMQCLTIWTIKGCLLIMYGRLTSSLKENLVVKAVAVYVVATLVFMEVFYLGVWCRPFSMYWAIPTTTQCSAATNHLITNAVFNISSDLFIICIPIPVFVRAQLPMKKKAILCGVFGLGAFSILSAVLNKYYSFTNPYGSLWTFWYVRESATAIITANLPFTWTLIQRAFNLRSWSGSRAVSRSTYTQFGPNTKNSSSGKDTEIREITDVESDGGRGKVVPLEIFQTVRIEVDEGKIGTESLTIKEVFDGSQLTESAGVTSIARPGTAIVATKEK